MDGGCTAGYNGNDYIEIIGGNAPDNVVVTCETTVSARFKD